MVSDTFPPGKKHERRVEMVIWQIWDLNSAKPVRGLLWSDQWQTVRTASWENSFENPLRFQPKILFVWVCVCVCTHAPFYKRLPMYVCVFTMEAFVSTKRQSHLSRRAYAFISSFYCRRTVDRKRNRLEQTNDATVTMTQTQLPFSPSFTFDCKDDKQSYRHLNQRADGHRQACRTTNTPKESHRLWGFVLLLMMPILESLVGVYSHCLLMSLPRTIPSHQTASDGWLN